MPPPIDYIAAERLDDGTAPATHVREIAAALRGTGHDVRVVSPATLRTGPDGSRLRNALRVSARALRSPAVLLVRYHPLLVPLLVCLRLLRRPTVVELNGPPSDLWEAYPALRPLRGVYGAVVRSVLRGSSAVITVSDQLTAWCAAHGVADATTVPNGANTAVFRTGHARPADCSRPYVLFFGSLAPWQGVGTMVSATAAAEWPADVELLVIGTGADQPLVDAGVAGGAVRQLPPMPQAALAAYVEHAAATLSVKDHPGGLSPLKVYESLSCGTRVICSMQPELAAVVAPDARLGVAIAGGDGTLLARTVADMLRTPKDATFVRDWACSHHSWDVSGRLVAEVLVRVATASLR